MAGNNLWEIVPLLQSPIIINIHKEEEMKLGILSVLIALVLCIGTVSAFSSIDYSIQANDAVVSVNMKYSNILENETILGSQVLRLDHMDVTSAGMIMGDDTGVVLNNTLRAVPVRNCLISSGMINQNFASVVRTNESYDLGVTGFRADGRMMDLASDIQAESGALSHVVRGQVAGNVGMGFITQTPTNRFESVVRSRSALQNVMMNANWQILQPAVGIEVPSSDISSLCVWTTQSSYPVFPISA